MRKIVRGKMPPKRSNKPKSRPAKHFVIEDTMSLDPIQIEEPKEIEEEKRETITEKESSERVVEDEVGDSKDEEREEKIEKEEESDEDKESDDEAEAFPPPTSLSSDRSNEKESIPTSTFQPSPSHPSPSPPSLSSPSLSSPSLSSSSKPIPVFPEIISTAARSSSYHPVTWEWLTDEGHMVIRFSTPMDGHCLFHAIANAYYAKYQAYNDNERASHVIKMRSELADRLGQEIKPGIKYYDYINGGHTKAASLEYPELKLESMQALLRSSGPVGFGFLDYLGIVFNKDIYILDANTKDVYRTFEYDYSIKGTRYSIVLYYTNNPGHFELVGLYLGDEAYTHFLPNNEFIKLLRSRM